MVKFKHTHAHTNHDNTSRNTLLVGAICAVYYRRSVCAAEWIEESVDNNFYSARIIRARTCAGTRTPRVLLLMSSRTLSVLWYAFPLLKANSWKSLIANLVCTRVYANGWMSGAGSRRARDIIADDKTLVIIACEYLNSRESSWKKFNIFLCLIVKNGEKNIFSKVCRSIDRRQ